MPAYWFTFNGRNYRAEGDTREEAERIARAQANMEAARAGTFLGEDDGPLSFGGTVGSTFADRPVRADPSGTIGTGGFQGEDPLTPSGVAGAIDVPIDLSFLGQGQYDSGLPRAAANDQPWLRDPRYLQTPVGGWPHPETYGMDIAGLAGRADTNQNVARGVIDFLSGAGGQGANRFPSIYRGHTINEWEDAQGGWDNPEFSNYYPSVGEYTGGDPFLNLGPAYGRRTVQQQNLPSGSIWSDPQMMNQYRAFANNPESFIQESGLGIEPGSESANAYTNVFRALQGLPPSPFADAAQQNPGVLASPANFDPGRFNRGDFRNGVDGREVYTGNDDIGDQGWVSILSPEGRAVVGDEGYGEDFDDAGADPTGADGSGTVIVDQPSDVADDILGGTPPGIPDTPGGSFLGGLGPQMDPESWPALYSGFAQKALGDMWSNPYIRGAANQFLAPMQQKFNIGQGLGTTAPDTTWTQFLANQGDWRLGAGDIASAVGAMSGAPELHSPEWDALNPNRQSFLTAMSVPKNQLAMTQAYGAGFVAPQFRDIYRKSESDRYARRMYNRPLEMTNWLQDYNKNLQGWL